MRFMLFMIPNIDEKDWMPDAEAIAAMTAYNEELEKAGVLLSLDGLHPTSKGARISGGGGKVTVTDGPFTESKEIIGGFWQIEVGSKDEAIEWARRCPAIQGPANTPEYSGPVPVIEIRQVFELSEFPEEVLRAAGQL